MFVYISEAHAQDVWPISSSRCHPSGKPVIINKHQSNYDRVNAAMTLVKDFELNWDVWYDSYPDELFEKTFSAWPGRFFVFNESKMIFANSTSNGGIFDIMGLNDTLNNLVSKHDGVKINNSFTSEK